MSVNEKILDAIELLTANAVQKAGYDKTIQAQIISCQDATIGKYKCRYQDSIFYAYSGNIDITYSFGDYVYILVPENNMSNEKTILGTTKKLGINYISQAEGDQAYDVIGANCVLSDNKYFLNTNNKKYLYYIYQCEEENNDITLSIASLNQYIKQASSIILGATFKTDIPLERQFRGHYGITFNLRFMDNVFNQQVVRSYTIDEDNMIDNPYKLLLDTRQYNIFDIDGENFIRIQSIAIFNQDFPDADGNNTNIKIAESDSHDITISKLEIFAAERMTNEQINGITISFVTPQGTFFEQDAPSSSSRTITAEIKIKGKIATSIQQIPFYWGSENVGVTAKNEYYNKYLGKGWKCLNQKNIIEEGDAENDPVIQWVPGQDTYILPYSKATARDNVIKVAAIYDGTIISKTINIQNLSSNVPVLTIESNEGTQFYYDVGHPTLTCKVNGIEQNNYTYYWAYEASNNNFEQYEQTTEKNEQYANILSSLNNLQNAIAAGTKFANAEANNIAELKSQITSFDYIQRVQNNKIYNVQIKNITNFGTFKCSVYNNNDVYLGTASIILRNALTDAQKYSLVINNGSAVFQYNENGIAPTSKSLDNPQTVQALTFTIYDNQGHPIGDNIISNTNNCQIRWKFPIVNTLLEDSISNGASSGTDELEEYKYYDNVTTLAYNIAQRYSIKNVRNQILLSVTYKGTTLTASTNFTFVKQGQPGTNGTEYLVKIVPNTYMQNPPSYPVITKIDNGNYYINYGIGSANSETLISANSSYKFFKAQLWHSGELVWEGFSTGQGGSFINNDDRIIDIQWSVLANKYTVNYSDASSFVVTDAGAGEIKYTGDFLKTSSQIPMANIIKCQITRQETNADINEVKRKKYYATIPVLTSWVKNDNYKVSLRDYTGFKYVVYTADGVLPSYDNSYPFEFICNEKINNIWENISLVNGDHSISYVVSAVGDFKSTYNGETINSYNLEILTSQLYRNNLRKNQWEARPSIFYDGICTNNAIVCQFKQNNEVIAYLHVPIHFLLNKFGFSYLNDWDGNSIQIDNDGGFILAPQMGAGAKNTNNQFTGILMGEVKFPGKSASDIGLIGLANGERSFFLNSVNGSALFGKQNSGQIVIDPSQNQALLYSHNFWKNYDDNGLPVSYGSYNYNGRGLLIDLTTPKILYGNGNFSVDQYGNMRVAGTGSIGGWQIGEEQVTEGSSTVTRSVLYSNIAKYNGRITLDAGTVSTNALTGEKEYTGPGKLYSHSHDSLTNTGNGFYISYDGFSIGSKFKVTNQGVVTIGAGAVDSDGSDEHWTIDSGSSQNNYRSYIQYGGDTQFNVASSGIIWINPEDEEDTSDEYVAGWDVEQIQIQDNAAKVYLGTDGIALGKKFSVDAYGNLRASTAILNNIIANNFDLYTGNIYENVTLHDSIYLYDGEERRKITWNKIDVLGKINAEGAKAVTDVKLFEGSYTDDEITEQQSLDPDIDVVYDSGFSNNYYLKVYKEEFIQNLEMTYYRLYILADKSERKVATRKALSLTADIIKQIIIDIGYDLNADFPLDDIDWDLFTQDIFFEDVVRLVYVNPNSFDPSAPQMSYRPVENWDVYLSSSDYEYVVYQIQQAGEDSDRMYEYTHESDLMPSAPNKITMVQQPNKTEYEYGEEIDYNGMIVAAWASPHTMTPFPFTGGQGKYKNIVPIEQLTLSVTIAGEGGIPVSEDEPTPSGGPGINRVPNELKRTMWGNLYYLVVHDPIQD